jgi:predicted peroxiredoxin
VPLTPAGFVGFKTTLPELSIRIRSVPDTPVEKLITPDVCVSEMSKIPLDVLSFISAKDVALFFDTEGVKLLTKTSKDIQMDNFMTMHSALDTLIQHKVRIMACPMCMAKAEIKPEDLKDGVIVAEAEKFFNFTKGRILTLDY